MGIGPGGLTLQSHSPIGLRRIPTVDVRCIHPRLHVKRVELNAPLAERAPIGAVNLQDPSIADGLVALAKDALSLEFEPPGTATTPEPEKVNPED